MSTPVQSLQQQRLLLQMEYYEEKEAFRKQTQQLGIERMVQRGDAWMPLRTGRSYYNSLNQLAIEVFRTNHQDIDHHFEPGRPVVFFRCSKATQPGHADIHIRYYAFTGDVSFVDGDRLVVTLPDAAPIADLQADNHDLGVQLSFDETSYRAMDDALQRTIQAKGNRLAQLRDWIYTQQPTAKSANHPATATEPARVVLPWLNTTQQQAVNRVLWTQDVTVVHGPPGTGKTTTLVEAINETLRRETQVLVCAQSNMAVDWIAEQLVDRGINVLRLGNPMRVNDKMLSFTYERRFEAHPDYTTLWSIRKAIRELRTARRRGSESYHQKMDRLKSRATELEIRIQQDLLSQAHVIAATLVGADSRLLHGMTFHTLFIDEAAQALEAACWIPMRRARRVVLAGDHCQLPPTVKSLPALKAGLGTTLMERIVENHPEVVTLLRIQYRMNEDIMRFSSDWFYGGQVESAPQVKHRGILDWDYAIEWRDTTNLPHPNDTTETNLQETDESPISPLAEETSPHTEETTPLAEEETPLAEEATEGPDTGELRQGVTLKNPGEAMLTIAVLQAYLTKIGKQRVLDEQIDVGIISPYRAQVQLLRHLIKRQPFFKPFRRLISVNTVDGFQGQERDVIILSLVRSNDSGEIGFLRDLRRMNVAITRARMKLIILGHRATLTRHPFYRRLWQYIQEIKENTKI